MQAHRQKCNIFAYERAFRTEEREYMPRTPDGLNFKALDDMQAKLERLGIPIQEIAQARTECNAQNSDQPFLELFKLELIKGRFKGRI